MMASCIVSAGVDGAAPIALTCGDKLFPTQQRSQAAQQAAQRVRIEAAAVAHREEAARQSREVEARQEEDTRLRAEARQRASGKRGNTG